MRTRSRLPWRLLLVLSLSLVPGSRARAQEPAASRAGGAAFDVEAATRAYLDRLSPEARARSDAYFEGGYWLKLWGFLYGIAVALVLLGTGLSRRMRDLALRLTGGRAFPAAALYGVQFLVAVALLEFPLSLYQGFLRERRYGLLNQGFGGWLGDELTGLMVGVVLLGGLALPVLYAVLRRAPRAWWILGSAASTALLALVMLIGPLLIQPLFNTYTPLTDEAVREPILSLARANGIQADRVYVMDASRQTTRVSANVSGLLGTMRITLNDNLLGRASLAEIRAVMGHELGHYVLNHIGKGIVPIGLLLVGGFAFLRWGFERSRRRWGARWGVEAIADPAGLPLLVALLSLYFFLMTPLTNSIIRVAEVEADLFGLNASREPDGMAEVALKLAEYRKLEPGPLEELVFFDHPSGASRIRMAMRWKAENLP